MASIYYRHTVDTSHLPLIYMILVIYSCYQPFIASISHNQKLPVNFICYQIFIGGSFLQLPLITNHLKRLPVINNFYKSIITIIAALLPLINKHQSFIAATSQVYLLPVIYYTELWASVIFNCYQPFIDSINHNKRLPVIYQCQFSVAATNHQSFIASTSH